MTDTTRAVFERYQIRKSKNQKTAFIEYVEAIAKDRGYACKVEKSSFGARNIVVGDPESAKVVYTAHYDTCARMPFPNFITPKNFFIYLLYNLVQVAVIFAVSLFAGFVIGFAVGVIIGLSGGDVNISSELLKLIFLIIYLALFFLMVSGPANKHTANDNTSGVTVLLDLMGEMPSELRNDAAFIFFDLEELGLFGSKGYATAHKNVMKNKLVVNFDCVSDGDNMIFVLKKGALAYNESISRAYESDENVKVSVETKGVFYPSDQASFNCGVGVAALKKSKRGILYMNKIHTPKDTVYREENIDFLVRGSVKLTGIMAEK